jgi:hypothetical protein
MPENETEVVEQPAVESPPVAARPDTAATDDPRAALNRLAAAITQQRDTRFLLEYLRLRRSLRA